MGDAAPHIVCFRFILYPVDASSTMRQRETRTPRENIWQ